RSQHRGEGRAQMRLLPQQLEHVVSLRNTPACIFERADRLRRARPTSPGVVVGTEFGDVVIAQQVACQHRN
ncbi:hypothetical protein, partial [Bradyrhizobium jicamae]|uniref:hypothetical protein n=1 Tax=Bradyrhizobium jicamae TaxID=280332 RepID=UPI001AEC8274